MMAQDQGWNLPEVIKAFGLDITRDVILPQNFTASAGFPLEILNLIYNASDCIISTTVGEGWGLSWTEAMSTKTPIIFPQNTCLPEYITEETGYPYPSGGDEEHITILPHDNEIPRPTAHINKLVERLVQLYNNREEGKVRAENAYKMVHSTLLWDEFINPKWIELFDQIVATSGAAAEIPAASTGTQAVLKGDLL